ncbi:unnamed protein product [Prorocentrum cordatum]|uniref:Glycosyltransferase family 92 protein n=1 Tax=Prorocentrum cordatum TaxID=2364126 RepID=A0ABN9WU06_9DINO|nr:unnamed protein product [Polarella glacialis]
MWALALGSAAAGVLPVGLAARLRRGEPWEPCATEGLQISAPRAGRVPVRFGWGDSWVEGELQGGSPCSAVAFDFDPAPGVRKVCLCQAASAPAGRAGRELREELGAPWSRCAAEGASCACPSGRVRFGTEGRWALQRRAGAAAPVQCDAESFGTDPAFQRQKECWCSEGQPKAQQVRAAIVMLSRHPPEFATWLRYHLDYMGVERVFVEVEDTPRFNATWTALPAVHRQRVTVWHPNPYEKLAHDAQQRPVNDYETLQSRQLGAMDRAKTEAASAGINWLIHIDDDELLYSPMRRPLAEVLGAMPSDVEQAYIPNVEAVYPSAEVRNCFVDTAEVNMNRYTFASYANGKSAVRLDGPDAEYMEPAGPHLWRQAGGYELPSLHLDEEPFGSPLYVVHFESCPFSRWEDKFEELGNTNSEHIGKIPFQFYRESIERMQHCSATRSNTHLPRSPAGSPLSANVIASGECSELELKKLWSHWKTEANPKLTRRDLMALRIPWQQIMTGGPA